jgi:hypothetical protein
MSEFVLANLRAENEHLRAENDRLREEITALKVAVEQRQKVIDSVRDGSFADELEDLPERQNEEASLYAACARCGEPLDESQYDPAELARLPSWQRLCSACKYSDADDPRLHDRDEKTA